MFMRSGLKCVCDWALLAHAGEDFGARITFGAIRLELGWCFLTFEKRIAGRGLVRGDHARAETCALGLKVAILRQVCLGIVVPTKRADGIFGNALERLFAQNLWATRAHDGFVHGREAIAGGSIGAQRNERKTVVSVAPWNNGNLSWRVGRVIKNDFELLIGEQRLARHVPLIIVADALGRGCEQDFRAAAIVWNRFDSIHRIGLLRRCGYGRLRVGFGWPGGIGIVRRCAIRLTLGRVRLGGRFGVW